MKLEIRTPNQWDQTPARIALVDDENDEIDSIRLEDLVNAIKAAGLLGEKGGGE